MTKGSETLTYGTERILLCCVGGIGNNSDIMKGLILSVIHLLSVVKRSKCRYI